MYLTISDEFAGTFRGPMYVEIFGGFSTNAIGKDCQGKPSHVATQSCTERLASAIFVGARFNCPFQKTDGSLCSLSWESFL